MALDVCFRVEGVALFVEIVRGASRGGDRLGDRERRSNGLLASLKTGLAFLALGVAGPEDGGGDDLTFSSVDGVGG